VELQITDNGKNKLELEGFQERVFVKYSLLEELGEAYSDAEQYDKAIEIFRKAIRHEPRFPSAHASLGMAQLRSGRLQEATNAFQNALKCENTHPAACRGMGMVFQRTGQFPRAFEMYLKALEQDTDDLLSLLGLFQTSCKMGTFGKITHYLETYLASHPEDTSVTFCLATLYAKEGRLDDARDQLMTLLTIEPGKEEAIHMLEKVQQHIQKRQAAESSPQKVTST
jgi:tetratricopeptide (TPR) repeat protein